MSREEFKEQVADLIEQALQRASGIGDWLPQPSPEQIAEQIADLAGELYSLD